MITILDLKECKAYVYCKEYIDKDSTPKYVKLAMQEFMLICEDKNEEFIINEEELKRIEGAFKDIQIPVDGGEEKPAYEALVGYQWLYITAMLCVVYRENPKKKRYREGILEVARRNYKTFTIAIIMLYTILTAPGNSVFFSIAPDKKLAKLVQLAMKRIIDVSPKYCTYKKGGKPHSCFRVSSEKIVFTIDDSTIELLSCASADRMDGRGPLMVCADEVGIMPNLNAINSMKSGALSSKNGQIHYISTVYQSKDLRPTPFDLLCNEGKEALEKKENKTDAQKQIFALLFEPDQTKDWEIDDTILKQANPALIEDQDYWKNLKILREEAIKMPEKETYFKIKHCNIKCIIMDENSYIDVTKVRRCRAEKIDWKGRDVYVGVDLSDVDDNTGVTMLAVDEDKNILIDSFAIIPSVVVDKKSRLENIDYEKYISAGKVIKCEGENIDKNFVADFIVNLEEKYKVRICGIGYDKYREKLLRNALQKAAEEMTRNDNNVRVEIVPQTSEIIYQMAEFLKLKILSREFEYEENEFLEVNFSNCVKVRNVDGSYRLQKANDRRKIDMVAAFLNALFIAYPEYFEPKQELFIASCRE